jgi:hypothetical protein
MRKQIRFCTSQRTLFVAIDYIKIKGLYQLCVKRYGTLYRVKPYDDEYVAYLDKSVNGKRWAVLDVDTDTLHPDRFVTCESLPYPLDDSQAAINVR